jgi:hypothetical protein
MRQLGHVACMGDRRGDTGFWWGNLRERDHLEDLGADRQITLKWVCGLDSSGSGQGGMAGWCEHDNEPLGSTKCGEFRDLPSNQ